MISARISATSMEYHTPSSSKNIGSISTPSIWNTSVRKNEIAADARPLLSAVKKEEPKIQNPDIKNEKEKMRRPYSVIL